MKVYIDTGSGVYKDYTQNVVQDSLVIEDSINVPTMTTMTLIATGSSFVLPKRSSYVKIVSEIYSKTGGYLANGQSPLTTGKVLASGFISNEPERDYLGLNPHLPQYAFQQYSYLLNVTSDDWIFNTRMVPFIPAFVDQTQGQILSSLAIALGAADMGFDVTSFVASGDIVPYFQYDPQQSWADIAKTFADASRYRYQVIDKVFYYQPFGDKPLGVSYDDTKKEKTFFPLDLKTGVLTVPPVNDALVLGDPEAQDKWDNYFIGDGFSSNFKLRFTMFRGSSTLLLSDDWTEASFQDNLWTVQDPQGVFSLNDNGQALGALNVNQKGLSGALNTEYILCKNGLELGGVLNVQTGEFQFIDVCNGIVGGVYSSSTLTQANCIAGFLLSGGVSAPSGAVGVVMQPIVMGVPTGPALAISQQNHHYQLEIWFGTSNWTRYQAAYRTMTGSAQYGGLQTNATTDITFIVRDLDLGFIIASQYQQFVQLGGIGPPLQISPLINQFVAHGVQIPSFGLYAPINGQDLNLALNFTQVSQPPQGTLRVASLTGASATELPVLPPNLWTVNTTEGAKLGKPLNYTLGFGLANPTATISQSGNDSFLSFFSDTIPGVGARIRFVAWANGQAMSRVQDPISMAQEAVISGDSGDRSAILTNLSPTPRTSEECELAAGAAILDRENPQFQGTYTVFTIPFRYEVVLNPGLTDYPRTGRFLFVNSPYRAISGENFFSQTIRTQVVDLREEILQVEVSYGPDQYLEKLLAKFIQRPEPGILGPTETQIPPNPIALSQVGSFYVPMFASGSVTAIVNALSGNYITVDLGQIPVSAAEVRRVDTGWGNNDQNLIGLFTTQQFNLPRTNRDQTWYIRPRYGSQTSRWSYVIRIVYPMIPSPPGFVSLSTDQLVLALNGDTRDIYGVELRLPGISGSYVINFPVGVNAPAVNTTGPAMEINMLQRTALANDTQPFNSLALVPQIPPPAVQTTPQNVGGGQNFAFQKGDVVLVQSPVNNSFNGLKVVSAVSNTPGLVPTLVLNSRGNYVDTYIWPNQHGNFNPGPGMTFPLNTGVALAHQVGNSLSWNTPDLGFGFDPVVQPSQWMIWGVDDKSTAFKVYSGFAALNYAVAAMFRIFVPAPGQYTLQINHDDGMFFGINGSVTLVSGPVNTGGRTQTGVDSLPVLGGNNADGVYTDNYVLNFPASGNYDCEIDYYQFKDNQLLGVNWLQGSPSPLGPIPTNGQDCRPHPGYMQQVEWFDVGKVFPVIQGTNQMPFTQTGTVTLQARNLFTDVSSGSITSGIATVNTPSPHGFNAGDVIVLGARITPLSAAGGSQDASVFTGQWTLSSTTPTSFTFTIGNNVPNQSLVNLIGVASQFLVNTSGAPPTSGQTVTLNAAGTLVQRPVFAPSDLIFDLTDPAIKNVLEVAQILNPSGFTVNAYFFNLTWDYSNPLNLTNVTVPTISGLTVDPLTQQAKWAVQSGVPTGYRVQISDPTTNVTYNLFTVDHPHNTQTLTSFKLLPSDYYNNRTISVTPFNALGPGPTLVIPHTALAATGIPVTEDYVIHSAVNGFVVSGQIVLRVIFDQGVIYSINMVPSQAWIDNPPTSGQEVFSIQQFTLGVNGGTIGTEIGCLTFTAGSHVGTFSVPAGAFFPVGDVIKFIATTDLGSGDGAGIAITVSGVKAFPSG